MKTLEMLFKAEHDGNTYNRDGLYYSKEKGFHIKHGFKLGVIQLDLNELLHDDGKSSNGWKLVDQTISFQEMCELAFSGEHTRFYKIGSGTIVYCVANGGQESFFWNGDGRLAMSINPEVLSARYKKV